MFKLMKYEFRKGLAPKGVILGVILALAMLYTGVFATASEDSSGTFVGMSIFFTVVVGTFAYFYVAFENVFSLYQEINSDRGYMIFMTPNSSYKIIAAKMVTGLIQMMVMVGVFLALIYYYVFVGTYFTLGSASDLNPFVILNRILVEDPDMYMLRIMFYVGVMWTFGLLFMMVAGSLSVVLTSFINVKNKALNVVVTFIVFLIIKFGGDFISTKMADLAGTEEMVVVPGGEFKFLVGGFGFYGEVMSSWLEATRVIALIAVLVYVALTITVYLLASWMLDKKVNL